MYSRIMYCIISAFRSQQVRARYLQVNGELFKANGTDSAIQASKYVLARFIAQGISYICADRHIETSLHRSTHNHGTDRPDIEARSSSVITISNEEGVE